MTHAGESPAGADDELTDWLARASPRLTNVLRNDGITTLDALAARSAAELLRIPNFARRSLRELVELLAAHGRALSGPPAFDPEPERDPIDLAFGSAVQERRRARAMTTTELAEAIGVSTRRVDNIERGRGLIAPSTLARLTRVLDAPVAELMKGPTGNDP